MPPAVGKDAVVGTSHGRGEPRGIGIKEPLFNPFLLYRLVKYRFILSRPFCCPFLQCGHEYLYGGQCNLIGAPSPDKASGKRMLPRAM